LTPHRRHSPPVSGCRQYLKQRDVGVREERLKTRRRPMRVGGVRARDVQRDGGVQSGQHAVVHPLLSREQTELVVAAAAAAAAAPPDSRDEPPSPEPQLEPAAAHRLRV